MDKTPEEVKTTILDTLNDIAIDYGWHVEIGTNNTFLVKNSQNHTVYGSSSPYEVAFWMGGNHVR